MSETPTKPRPTLMQRVEYALLRAGLGLAGLVSVDRLSNMGAAVMRLVGPRLRQNRRALQNLAIAFPEKSPDEIRQIASDMWANMGRTFAETLVLDALVGEPGRIDLVEKEKWQARLADGIPTVGCTLHMGNWEIAILPLREAGRRPTGVYKPLENPLIDAWLAETRRGLYPGGLVGKGDRDEGGAGQRAARRLIDRARSGSALGFVCDHFDRRGEPIVFMGRLGRFTTAPAMIARHVGARVLVGHCVRAANSSRFRIVYEELEVPRTSDKRGDALALTTAIFAKFESLIRAHPDQWMWWNTRWVEPAARDGSEDCAARAAQAAAGDQAA